MEGMDLSGMSTTDSVGRMMWRLSKFLCSREKIPPIDFPDNFVTTPFAGDPVYMTVVPHIELLPDLVYEVYSWDKNGEPAPSIHFYWRCRFPIRKPI
jgi:hypothetical protein